jgi:hypothetical protein
MLSWLLEGSTAWSSRHTQTSLALLKSMKGGLGNWESVDDPVTSYDQQGQIKAMQNSENENFEYSYQNTS